VRLFLQLGVVNLKMWLELLIVLLVTSLVNNQNVSLTEVIKSVANELSPDSILLLRFEEKSVACWNENSFLDNVPILNFNGDPIVPIRSKFNSNILGLVCLDNEGKIMETLYSNLKDMRDAPTILFALTDKQIHDIFLECRIHKMLNVLAFKNLEWWIVYSYRAFPTFEIVKRNVSGIHRYFEPQLKDLGGHVLKAMPDNIMPRTVVYRDRNGNRQMGGYLGEFIRNYARTLNATLKIRWDLVPEEGMTHLSKVSQIIDVDFPIGIDLLDIDSPKHKIPIEISSMFLMIPMEPSVPRAEFFGILNLPGLPGVIPMTMIMTAVLCVAYRLESGSCPRYESWVVADKVLRGLLAQPFILPRCLCPKIMFIYWLLLISGFFMTNYYSANLETWLVHPPTGNRIRTWEQLRHVNLKILTVRNELDFLSRVCGTKFFESNQDMFAITDSADYQRRRMTMDRSYAYTVTLTLWPHLQKAQVRLHRPSFRRSEEIVFLPFLVLAMPLPENSIYQNSLQRYAERTRQSGLYRFWFERSFDELTRLGKMSYMVDDQDQAYRDLKWEDFSFVWLTFVVLNSISLLLFLLELGHYRWQMRETHLSLN
ncbi:hypothetical protein KR009_003519, partial [Drosophila setifemur]